VAASRRSAAVVRLADYARQQAAFARRRSEAWAGALPGITADGGALDASLEAVTAIARKAEAKARAASSAKGAKASGAAAAATAGARQGGAPWCTDDGRSPACCRMQLRVKRE